MYRIPIILFAVLLSLPLLGQENEAAPNTRQSLAVYFENDLVVGTDRFYTSGARITWLSQDLESLDGHPWAELLRDWFPFLDRTGYTHNVGLAIGQNIFTPEDTTRSDLILDDRPYAGWLYGAASVQHKSSNDLHRLELTLGIVGEDSLADETQNRVHAIRGIPKAEGWEHQLAAEPGLILTYDYKRRYDYPLADNGLGVDIIPSLGASLGNVLTEANVGTTVRMGYHLPNDFHGNRIRVSGYAMPTDNVILARSSWSFYLFASAAARFIARDVFLDGNTFTDSHSVGHKPLVGEFELGFGLRYKEVRLSYAQVLRSKEFDEQSSGQQFGALSLSYAF